MFHKILIANRGEIAVRIIRACRDMGIISVAVYSEADKTALHTQIADEAVCIGPGPSKDSYLNMDNIISAALLTGAQAVHPGFGFLSENPVFAKKCVDNDLIFIGPKPETIAQMGDKIMAKEMAKKAGVPLAGGSNEPCENLAHGKTLASSIGYPVMLKAASGGGGKGIRILHSEDELIAHFDKTKAEAAVSFGDDRVYLEKFIEDPKHIEIQLLGDKHGNVVHLYERECSIQRRQQKLIEEAPSASISADVRKRMGDCAVALAKLVGYEGAGTIEFLLDKDQRFYFCEMNTRIQVEHPVTEAITGIDLIVQQIKVAAGEPLPFTQAEIPLTGHAIECRINAENPEQDFSPCPGEIRAMHLPGGIGVRMDTAIYQGYTVPPYYDSMVGKLICYGRDRNEAIARMKRALSETLIDGIITNADYQLSIINSPLFLEAGFTTNSVEKGEFR